ncbi:hypothetical protein Tco_0644559 [Tanacetum coccineum]
MMALGFSSSVVAKLSGDFSEIEVQEKKMDPARPVCENLYDQLDGILTSPIPPTYEKINEGLQPVGEVMLTRFRTVYMTQPGSSPTVIQLPQKEVISSVCGDHEIDLVSSQKEYVSASDGRLSPVPLAECNESAHEDTPSIATDQNEAYGIDTGSLPDPGTKDDKKSCEKRICLENYIHRLSMAFHDLSVTAATLAAFADLLAAATVLCMTDGLVCGLGGVSFYGDGGDDVGDDGVVAMVVQILVTTAVVVKEQSTDLIHL